MSYQILEHLRKFEWYAPHLKWLGYDVENVDAKRANLRVANLRGADLCGADLRGTDLRGTDLRGANLCEANLRGANPSGADLREANLRGANLCGADLRCADLRGANLSGAKISWQSHDLLSEILLQAANDIPKRKIAGLILVSRDWYWEEFLAIDDEPLRDWALDELAKWVQPGDGAPECVSERAAVLREGKE